MLAKRILVLLVSVFAMSAWWLDSATASDCAPAPNADLANCDFSFADLANADLRGSNLSNADFASADLTNANLAGANVAGSKLSSATITNLSSGFLTGTPASLPSGWKLIKGYIAGPTANLTNATLTGATLTGLNLSSANLEGVKSGGVIGTPTLPGNWRTFFGYLIGPKANLSGAQLKLQQMQAFNFAGANLDGADLSGATIQAANFSGSSLVGANLSKTSVSNAVFTNADLTRANLSGLHISGIVYMDSATLDGVTSGGFTYSGLGNAGDLMLPTGWRVKNGYIAGPKANLVGADISRVSLTDVDLSMADLTHVSSGGITGTPIALPPGWLLLKGYLVGPKANLTGAGLSGADFLGVSLEFANLTNASITNSNLSGVDMSSAILVGLGATSNYPGPSSLPSPWIYRDGNIYGPGMTFRSAVASDLSNLDLNGATFVRLNLAGCDFTGTDLSGSTFTGGTFTDTKFISADLTNATFTSGDINGANFSGSTLTGVKSTSFFGTPLLPAEWKLIAGSLVGPGANLVGINFVRKDMSGANLDNADLTLAILTGVKSGSITGTPKALPAFWILQNGYLIGSGADLTGADLTGANLESLGGLPELIAGANFTNARMGKFDLRSRDLRGNIFKNAYLSEVRCNYCNLSGVDLSGANLSRAQMYEANLTGANLASTDFTAANLENVNLASVNATSVNLATANLTGLASGGVVGVPASLPSGWRLTNGFFVGSGADLTSASVGQVDLSGMTLTSATLTGTFLDTANLSGLKMTGITGLPAALPAGWKVSKGILLGPDANLEDLNLAAVSLTGVNLSNANLKGVASNAIVGSPSAVPSGWRLFKGQLIGPGANLTDSILTGMNLDGVSLGETTLVRVTSGGITGTPSALPDNWKLINGYLIGREAILKNANFANQNLSGVTLWFTDMAGANLTNVTSGGIDGIPGNLPTNWTVVSGYLFGPGANLQGADLTGAELMDLNVSGIDLSDTSLLRVKSARLTGTPSGLPEGWRVLGGFLLGPTADLESAELAGVDLSGQDLSGANLKWIRLQGANLVGTILDHADLTNAFLAGANLVNVNLQDTILKDADLSGVNSSQLTGTPSSLPANWYMVSGVLLQKMPTVTAPTLGRAVVGQTLTPQLGTIPAGATATYSWLDGETPISGATGSSLLIGGTLVGHDISVRVTISKIGFEEVILKSLATKVSAGSLTLTAPKILGGALVGSTLTLESLSIDGDTKILFEWLENGTPKAGATSAKLAIVSTMLNKELSARVTVSKPGYESLILNTSRLKVGLGVLPAVTPKITGTAKVAKTLTAVSAKWASVATIQYQWLLDGKAIKGATKSTYKLLPTQKGRKISVQVTQIAAGYKSALKISTALKVG